MKLLKKRTVKEKILIAFFTYSTISFFVAVLSFLLFREMEKIEAKTSKVNELFIKTLHSLRYGQDFFVYDIINYDFYKSGSSPSLVSHDKLLDDVSKIALELEQESGNSGDNFNIEQYVVTLRQILTDYDSIYATITGKIRLRGIDEFGLQGEMKTSTLRIENKMSTSLTRLQNIRKIESEYHHKHDTSLIMALEEECKALAIDIKNSNSFNTVNKKALITDLNAYTESFREIVKIDVETGYKTQTGLSFRLKIAIDVIDAIVSEIDDLAKKRKNQIIKRLQMIMVIIVTFSVILTLFLSIAFKFVVAEE